MIRFKLFKVTEEEIYIYLSIGEIRYMLRKCAKGKEINVLNDKWFNILKYQKVDSS